MSEQWVARAPEQACDLVDYLISSPWPMTKDEFQERAVADLGWSIEVEKDKRYLMDTASGIRRPDVGVIDSNGAVGRVRVPLSDRASVDTEESRASVGDAFALTVAEGSRRWGPPTMARDGVHQSATWMNPDGSRTEITAARRFYDAMFTTAARVAIDRADEGV